MSYEENRKSLQRPHSIIMEERKKLSVSGVEDVESFDDTQIVMRTVSGDLIIRGSELQIDKLSLDTGDVNVMGTISELSYEETISSGSLWSKLFR